MVNESESKQQTRRRGAVLRVIYLEHERQADPLDLGYLWGWMQDMRFGVGKLTVIALLQDLCDRGYLRFTLKQNEYTGETDVFDIKLLPAGRDVVERRVVDPAVLIY